MRGSFHDYDPWGIFASKMLIADFIYLRRMENRGLNYQTTRYTGMDPYREFPISIGEWRSAARTRMPEEAWGYLEGGAGSESTMNGNIEAFSKWKLRPRYLKDVSERDISARYLGRKESTPFILAPIGVMSIISRSGEVAAARAAGKFGIPFVLSTVSSSSIEEVASKAESTEKWFQIYPGKDVEIVKSMIRRAENAGYSTLVVTVDTTMLGWRERDLKNEYLPFLKGEGIANYLTDEVSLSRLQHKPEQDMNEAVLKFLSVYVNPSFSWSDLREIIRFTRLPVVLKGISHPDDVATAVESGVKGIVVSNHGGRQVDGAVSTIDSLAAITDVGPVGADIFLDSGIRHASDAMKAIALGARAVLIGRPYAYALAVGGERAVEAYLNQLTAEMDLQMGLPVSGLLTNWTGRQS
jgi:L-lactate dehydrogenase (FMN-dependent) and related alpha-hydroxy acid dehydrogenases